MYDYGHPWNKFALYSKKQNPAFGLPAVIIEAKQHNVPSLFYATMFNSHVTCAFEILTSVCLLRLTLSSIMLVVVFFMQQYHMAALIFHIKTFLEDCILDVTKLF